MYLVFFEKKILKGTNTYQEAEPKTGRKYSRQGREGSITRMYRTYNIVVLHNIKQYCKSNKYINSLSSCWTKLMQDNKLSSGWTKLMQDNKLSSGWTINYKESLVANKKVCKQLIKVL